MKLRLAVAVDRLDEARELRSGGADGADGLLVVHAHRPDEADRAERAVHEAVARADERDLAQRRMRELCADADERPPGLGRRVAEHFEEGRALLDEIEQVAVGVELLGAYLAEQVGRTADVEALRGRDELGERRPQRGEERALVGTERRVVDAAAEQRRAE